MIIAGVITTGAGLVIGIPGVYFCSTGQDDMDSVVWRRRQLSGLPPSQGGLTNNEVKVMVDAGWELDTQGISHADLITLDAAQLKYQIDSARKTIQRRYGVPVNWFCYPSGHYDTTPCAPPATSAPPP